jgi:hypothetical protein
MLKSENFFPPPSALPNSDIITPYLMVGDDAFCLGEHMMKPYSKTEAKEDVEKEIFNYRLSRVRRVSENSFGLLSQVFRVFYTPLAINPETSDALIMTAAYTIFSVMPISKRRTETTIIMTLQHLNLRKTLFLYQAMEDIQNYRDLLSGMISKNFNNTHGSLDWQNKTARASDTVN